MRDSHSLERIGLLHPLSRKTFTDFINECEETFNITLRVVQGYRTIKEQDDLYAQGRTKPGLIVTNARGGQSYHNYGLAVDLAEMVDNDTHVDWNFNTGTLKPIADKYGLEWGGTWHKHDKPHFELRKVNGVTYSEDCHDLLALYKQNQVDKDGYLIL